MAEPEEQGGGEDDAPQEWIIPETGLRVTYTEEWIAQWNKEPSDASILELRDLNALQFRDEILCDFMYYNLMHCRSICLGTKGTAIFCTLMDGLAMSMTEPTTSLDSHFHTFSESMKAHRKAGYFSPEESKLMIDYVVGTFFKHFTLYRMCLDFVQKPARRFMCEVALEEPSFPARSLAGAENISQKARDAEPPPPPAEEAGGTAAKEDGEENAEEEGAEDDPLPPELERILELEVTTTEARIREKLMTLHDKTNKK
mmetsp:Transcript_27785/g.70172  ORF Transcript_27785/g.70172 Transcript_27785/m.70172 type:complete len:257 (-) Transcript_27785:208-978(-)|eukprot:CAMPEP_0178994882 /NCGR_PEP_ID=MMETSP0795-20121207/7533_1 /TAXON_ID=88552 /ORGANISM="Amoebophrya sp., Strain Ameob2" /LENGTH=256 /DNA_ID=CAMNT_0020687157 /DNA_START=369 /DNA_END=1139 /DNA_ORIENTATION=+